MAAKMKSVLEKCKQRLLKSGLVVENSLILAARDYKICWNNQSDSPQKKQILQKIMEKMDYKYLIYARLELPWLDIIRFYANKQKLIIPDDSETRTFFHAIPILSSLNFSEAAEVLVLYPVAVLPDGSIIAGGRYAFLEPYVLLSSVCFALFVKFMADYLMDNEQGKLNSLQLDCFKKTVAQLNLPYAPDFDFEKPQDFQPELNDFSLFPEVAQKLSSFQGELSELMEMTGKLTVDLGLVDSFFGNISVKKKQQIRISRSGVPLDELAGNLVAIDGLSTLGIIASSEFSAHDSIYKKCSTRSVLHGHPLFSVILSLACFDFDCPARGKCHLECFRPRFAAKVRVVPGEVGTGRYGLVNTIPPALENRTAAIVYGHGVFVRGENLPECLLGLLQIERRALAEYFRKLFPFESENSKSSEE
jgi:ribulose-5-phosphate 4-epimerase/fuculose-1-phosphate aldolase